MAYRLAHNATERTLGMDLAFIHGRVLLEHELIDDGAVAVNNGVIAWAGPTEQLPAGAAKSVDLGGLLLAPGFVDLHVHGGGGVDSTCTEREGLQTILHTHEAFGTTSLCLALPTMEVEALSASLRALAGVAASAREGARLLGSYLEGPFLNPSRCGALSPAHVLEPDLDILARLARDGGGWLRVVTVAPELPGIDRLIKWLSRSGIIAAIGHTSATCEQTRHAIQSGCRLATHLFNGMKPFHHRDPNAPGAVLTSHQVCAELVVDETHLHPATVHLVWRALGPDRIALVTDSTSVLGSSDGTGKLGTLDVTVQDGAARLPDGRLAGSTLNMADAVRNFTRACGLDIPSALRCATMVPASLLGISDRIGSIAPGKYADLIVLDPADFRVLQTYVAGRRVFRSPY